MSFYDLDPDPYPGPRFNLLMWICLLIFGAAVFLISADLNLKAPTDVGYPYVCVGPSCFPACLTGPDPLQSPSAECELYHDHDNDGDIDLHDFRALQTSYLGHDPH